MEAVSLRISKSTTTQFSLIISESIGAVGAVKSMRHHWKQFRWWFLSQQGLIAVSNPCVTRGSSFVDYFWSHLGFLRCRIHASSVAAVLLRISQTAATLFSMIISESRGAVCAIESMRHPCQQFRWWFLSPQRLFSLSNPCVTRGSSFVDYFWVGSDSVFVNDFWSHRGSLRCRTVPHPWKQFCWWFLRRQRLSFRWWFLSWQGLFVLSNPCVTLGSSFVDDFWVHSGSLLCRIHTSPVEVVSLMISESTTTLFSLIISETTGVFALSNPCVTRGSSFVDDF